MAIQYTKLFKLLEERDILRTELQKGIGISSATMAKLTKNEPVSLKVIECLWQDKPTYNCSAKVHNSASSLGQKKKPLRAS